MEGFWSNFLANFFSDILLAVAVYLILTKPGEKKRATRRRLHALGLLKTEVETNRDRIHLIAKAIEHSEEDKITHPFHFTRGAWNALMESGFMSELDDPILAYRLFHMNEICVVANNNLRLWERAYILKNDGKATEALRIECLRNCASLRPSMDAVLNGLSDVKAVSINHEMADDCSVDSNLPAREQASE